MLKINRLKELRKQKKITQKQLAEKLGKAAITVHKWEKGERNPGAADIRLIANILDINVSEISDLKTFETSNSLHKQHKENLLLSSLEEFINKFQNIHNIDISEFKLLHNTLQEQKYEINRLRKLESQYKEIINSVPDIIYVKDINLKYKAISNSFLNIVGGSYAEEDIINSKATDIFGFKAVNELLQIEKKAIESGEKIIKQVIIPNTKKIGLATVKPNFGLNNNVENITCCITDITELIKANDRQNELIEVINNLDEMIWIKRLQPKEEYKFVSDGAFNVLGYTPLEVTANPRIIIDNIHPEDIIGILDKSTKYLKLGTHHIRVKNASGIYRWLNIKIFKQNEIYCGIIRDITEQKEKSLIISTVLKALAKSNIALWLSYLPEEAENIVDNFKYSFISPNIDKIHYTKPDEISISPKNWLKSVYEKDKSKVMKFILGKNMNDTRHIDYRVVSPNGSIKWISSYIYKLDKHLYYGYISDITDRKETERQNKAMLAAIQSSKDGIWLKKADNIDKKNNIFLSKAVGTLFNESLGNLIQNDFHFRDEYIISKNKEFLNRKNGKIKYSVKLKNNEIKDIEETIIQKNIFGSKYFGGTLRDVTNASFKNELNRIILKIINNLNDFLVTVSLQQNNKLKYLFISDNIKSFTGFEKKQFIENPNFWNTRTREENQASKTVTRNEASEKTQYLFETKDGKRKKFKCLTYTYLYEEKTIIVNIIELSS